MTEKADPARAKRSTISSGAAELSGTAASGAVPLLLIHGVGHFQSGDIKERVAARLHRQGISGVVPIEFDWDRRVKQLEQATSSALNWERVHRLGLALSRAAWLNIGAERRLPRAVCALWIFVSALVAVILLSLHWWGLASLAAAIPSVTATQLRVGLPWTSYLFPPLPANVLAGSAPYAEYATGLSLRLLGAAALAAFLVTWWSVRLRLAVALRVLTLEILWPPVYALGALPVFLGALAAMSIGIALTSTFAAIKGTVVLADDSFWEVGPGFLQLAAGAGITVGLVAAAAVLAWVSWRLLEPVFDVAYYLGDEAIRDYIHEQLEDDVRAMPGGRRIIVAGHSLGSVIAVDSLLRGSGVWSRFRRIDLVTAGSPLQRLLAKFFPDAYPSPDRLAAALAACHGDLSWTNLYRVTDYVGGRLDGRAIVNRRLLRRWWSHHANYWTDSAVITCLARHLGAAGNRKRLRANQRITAPSNAPAGSEMPNGVPAPRYRSPEPPRLSYVRYLVPAAAIIGMMGIIWSQFAATPRLERNNLTTWQGQITAAPRDTTVRIQRGEFVDTAAETGSYELIGFSYEVGGRRYDVASPPDWIPYATSRFPHVDWRRLKRDADEATDALDVVVQYAAADPAMFRLPDYEADPPYYSVGRLILYSLRTFILSVFWIFWCAILYMLVEGISPSTTER